MSFSFSKEFAEISNLTIESAFISEYLPVSSGEAVKVYLYGLLACSKKEDKDLKSIAEDLNLDEKTILDCLSYWEEFGLINILSKDPLNIVYLPVKSVSNAKPRKIKAEKYTEFSKGLQLLLPSRMISTGEFTEYFNVMETYSIKPEAMLLIVKYCADRKGDTISYRYVTKVAKDFGNRGINTVEKVEKELSSYLLRTSVLEKILKALKTSRQPDIDDQNLLKKWTNELGFDEENILFAAKSLKKGNMEKLDEFLLELYSIKCFSKEEIKAYLENKQSVYDLAVKINKALSIYVDVIETVVNTYTKKWLSFGFDEETLLLIASKCFTKGKNSLSEMDETIEVFRNRGIIDLSSVGDFFATEKKTEEFIKQILLTSGINRRPTSWDVDNLNTWRSWNFSNEMILEAAKLASGKASPVAYMNSVLSSWKNNGIFSLEGTSSTNDTAIENSVKDYNKEYERRRTLALSKAQKNTEKAMELQGFSTLYERVFSIERDMAFAEMGGDQSQVEKLENEKTEITIKLDNLLSKIGLDLSDLSPKFACEKCQDTGYVGTKRCDCFNKKVD